MKWVTHPTTFLMLSWSMFLGGCIGFILGVIGKIGSAEPPLVLGLSWLALVISGYGNIVSAHVNKKLDKE